MSTKEQVEVIACGLDGSTDEAEYLQGKVYLDVMVNGDGISGWVKPTTAALIKGMDKKNCLASGNVVAELAQVGEGMIAAGKAMREATSEIYRQRAVITELVSCLKAIHHEYDQTYDASIEPGNSHWTAAASIPVEVMQHATRLLAKHG
jgi:hypothetical protein